MARECRWHISKPLIPAGGGERGRGGEKEGREGDGEIPRAEGWPRGAGCQQMPAGKHYIEVWKLHSPRAQASLLTFCIVHEL